MPGRDFQIFHGLGTTLLHYPVFAGFDGDLYGSEVARRSMSPFLFILAAFSVAYLTSRSLAVSFVVSALMVEAAPYLFSKLYDPANSMLGVRSAFGIFACASFLIDDKRWRYIAFSALTALAIIGSTEQGIAVVLAAVFVGVIVLLAKRSLVQISTMLPAIVFALIFFFAFSGSGLPSLLQYSYRDVMQDQSWYFGAPPNPFGLVGIRLMSKGADFQLGAAIAALSIGLFIFRLCREGLTNRVLAAQLFLVYGGATLGSG